MSRFSLSGDTVDNVRSGQPLSYNSKLDEKVKGTKPK